MRITSKVQVTIPQAKREKYGLFPLTDVEFVDVKGGLLIKKVEGSRAYGDKIIDRMRDRSNVNMSTDEIMKLKRG